MIYSLDTQLSICNSGVAETLIKKSLLICKRDDRKEKHILRRLYSRALSWSSPGICDLFSCALQLQFLDDCTNEVVGSMSQRQLTIHWQSEEAQAHDHWELVSNHASMSWPFFQGLQLAQIGHLPTGVMGLGNNTQVFQFSWKAWFPQFEWLDLYSNLDHCPDLMLSEMYWKSISDCAEEMISRKYEAILRYWKCANSQPLSATCERLQCMEVFSHSTCL
jgi:hypothetical protein